MRNALSKVGDKARKVSRTRITAALLGGALVLMLGGGTAVASGHIGGDDIRNYSIDKQHLKKDSVGSWEVIDRSLRGGELRKDSVGRWVFTPYLRSMIEEWEAGEFDGQKGDKGDQGEPGEDGTDGTNGTDGQDGTDGKDGVSGYEVVGRTDDRREVPANGTVTITTKCLSDNQPEDTPTKVAIGGGAKSVEPNSGDILINATVPGAPEQVGPETEQDPAGVWASTSWEVTVTNIGDSPETVQPYVLCALMN